MGFLDGEHGEHVSFVGSREKVNKVMSNIARDLHRVASGDMSASFTLQQVLPHQPVLSRRTRRL